MLFLDRTALRKLANEHRTRYAHGAPFPHVVLDGFLGAADAAAVSKAFPPPSHPGWMRRDYPQQSARLGQLQRTGFAGVERTTRMRATLSVRSRLVA